MPQRFDELRHDRVTGPPHGDPAFRASEGIREPSFAARQDQGECAGPKRVCQRVGGVTEHQAAELGHSAAGHQQQERFVAAPPFERRQGLHVGGQWYASQHGRTICDAAVGETYPGVAMRRDTVMLWLSSTKPIVAAAIMQLHEAGRLGEPALTEFAKAGRFEETVAALAALGGAPVAVVDRLIAGDRPDPVLIICKALGFAFPTVKAIMELRTGGRRLSPQALDDAVLNFERLSPATAQRVLRFWQARQLPLETAS